MYPISLHTCNDTISIYATWIDLTCWRASIKWIESLTNGGIPFFLFNWYLYGKFIHFIRATEPFERNDVEIIAFDCSTWTGRSSWINKTEEALFRNTPKQFQNDCFCGSELRQCSHSQYAVARWVVGNIVLPNLFTEVINLRCWIVFKKTKEIVFYFYIRNVTGFQFCFLLPSGLIINTFLSKKSSQMPHRLLHYSINDSFYEKTWFINN